MKTVTDRFGEQGTLTNLQFAIARKTSRRIKKRLKAIDRRHADRGETPEFFARFEGVCVDTLVEKTDINGSPMTDAALRRRTHKQIAYLDWHTWMWSGEFYVK